MKKLTAILVLAGTLAIASKLRACDWGSPEECPVCPDCQDGPYLKVKVEAVSLPGWVVGHLVK